MTSQEKAELFAGKAPPLNREEREKINNLFPTYIFRQSKTDELWTSCCHQHLTGGVCDSGLRVPEGDLKEVWSAGHQREPRKSWSRAPEPSVRCPVCGKMALVKDLRYCGKRENLSRYRRAVVLRWYRGALWARAYDCGKHYKDGYSLTGEPECNLIGVYRFRPGLAEYTKRYFPWGDYPFTSIVRQDGPPVKGKWKIHGPFNANAEYGIGYDVLGVEEVQKSPFRYCMAEEGKKFTKFLEYLAACCFYPRQIEMLMKAGMRDVVMDFVERGVKHAAVLDWDAENPAKAFKVSRQDVKTFLGTSRDIQILELYKRLKGRAALTECAAWMSRGLDIQKTFRDAKKWGLEPEKLIRYLDGNVGCARYGGMSSIDAALRYWGDYLTAAEAMGYPLHRENVLLPKNLREAHDKATGEHREKLQRELEERQRERDSLQRAVQADRARQARLMEEKYVERRKKLEKKYAFALDGYVIRVPADKDEILAEGRTLKHCVSGYAERHIEGKTVILFMRKAQKPEEPWLTIEMSKNDLIQIHGYKNEGLHTEKGRFAPDPREEYREFLDVWLEWLDRGSRRNKNGEPQLPKKKGAAA